MNIILKYATPLMLALGMGFTACSDGSENLTPSEPEISPFEVDPSSTDPESLIRLDFYKQTGIYLVFRDKLQKADGTYEDIDFNWEFYDYGFEDYQFTEIETIESKKIAAEILARYFVPYIKDGKIKPFSMLASYKAELLVWDRNNREYVWQTQNYISNWRCFAVSTINWDDLTDEEYREAGMNLLKDFINAKLNENSPELSEFFLVNKNEYWGDIEDYIPGFFDDEEDMSLIYNYGFLSYDEYWEGFLTEEDDLEDFKNLVLNYSEEEVLETYGNYAKIIQKYNLLKQAISDMGINLNAEIK